MAGKFFRNYFTNKTKKLDKENLQEEDVDDINSNLAQKRVNFRENPARSSLKGGRKAQFYSYTPESYDEDDEDDSSEVTLKLPLQNPYHVITEPKKIRATQSLAAGELLSESGPRHRTAAASANSKNHELSFRSDYFLPSDEPMAFGGSNGIHQMKRNRRAFEDARFERLISTRNNSIDLDALRDIGNHGINEGGNPKSLMKMRDGRLINNSRHPNTSNKTSVATIFQYEERCRILERQLDNAIDKVREERGRRKHFERRYNDAVNRLELQQKEIDNLRLQQTNQKQYEELLGYLRQNLIGQNSNQNPATSGFLYQNQNTNMRAIGMNPLNPLGSGATFGQQNSQQLQQHLPQLYLPKVATGEVLSLQQQQQFYQQFQHQYPNSGLAAPPASLEDELDENGTRKSPVFPSLVAADEINGDEKATRGGQRPDTNSFSSSPRSEIGDNEEMNRLKAELETDLHLCGDNSSRSYSDQLSSSLELEMSRNGRVRASASCLEISFNVTDKNSSVLVEDVLGDHQARDDDGYATSDATINTNATTIGGPDGFEDRKVMKRRSIC